MYAITFLTYIKENTLPNRFVYAPAFVGDTDSIHDVTELNEMPNPNVVMWEGVISAATLDAWLADPEIFVLMYEAIDEPV